MRIGIVGAGNIGGTLTRRLAALGHDVSVANSRDPDTLRELASETGAGAVTATEAARGKDVVIVTIPQARIAELPDDLFTDGGGAAMTTVIDTGNYYPRQRDGAIEPIEQGVTESAWVENELGHPVIKAFNTTVAEHLLNGGRPPGTPERFALPVAGDDERAKAIVMRLIDELGFDPVDAGGIDESWRQQPGSPVYANDLPADELRDGLAQASPERAPEWQATRDSPGSIDEPR